MKLFSISVIRPASELRKAFIRTVKNTVAGRMPRQGNHGNRFSERSENRRPQSAKPLRGPSFRIPLFIFGVPGPGTHHKSTRQQIVMKTAALLQRPIGQFIFSVIIEPAICCLGIPPRIELNASVSTTTRAISAHGDKHEKIKSGRR